jgi:ketosteroid isomerase-like protein/catechol 2,3-dioxygenase-like lactoylglutathione lyase family enzyme
MSSDNAALVRDGFQAFLRGDFDALSELIDPAAQWLWWEPIPGDCDDRNQILAMLRDRQREGVVTGLENVVEGGEKVFVEVSGPNGRASMVVTVRDGRIVRMQDHRTRTDALVDAGLAGRPAMPPPAPLEHTEPGWERVTDLVAFVHVADVDASIAFYGRLGFQVTATHPEGAPSPDWAWLEADRGRLMLARSDSPIPARSQGVLFYLYARDLFGLRARLVAAGVHAGEIRDGRPGPRMEMRVADPDGYVLMIAQIDVDRTGD